MNKEIDVNIQDYLQRAEESIQKWYDFIQVRNLNDAISLCQYQIAAYKDLLKSRNWANANESDYDNIFIISITFKAFQDYSELGKITIRPKWEEENSNVEEVWLKLWDAKDRLDFVHGRLQSRVVNRIRENLEELLDQYKINFGHGLYASPEILIKKETCSICNKDIRACSHVTGRLYDGSICRGVAEDFELKTISLVTVPKDPRCRIWPWKEKEERVFEMIAMTFFQVDDFLNDEN